jgi:hypothetical protein
MNKVYIGSTMCGLDNLEKNHRGARDKNYSMTKFRLGLENELSEGKFSWLVTKDDRTQREVEELERDLINKYMPEYNKDYNPVATSERYGRYDDPKADIVTGRGVYMYEVYE